MPKNKTDQAAKNKKKQDDEEDDADEDADEDDEDEEEADDVEVEEDDEEEEEEAPKKGKKGKGKGEKTGRGSGLVPREPVSVDKAVFKAQTPEVQKLLKTRDAQQAAGDKKGLRKTRAALRKAGFRLSNVNAAAEE